MRIEDEIKTDKFQNEVHKAHINILFTASMIRNRINASLRDFDLSSEQFNVLRIVRGQGEGGAPVKEISSRMLEKSSNTTRIIDRLIQKQLLIRQKSGEGDARQRFILITSEGVALLKRIDKHWKEASPHESSISHENAHALNQLLDKIRE
jgi:DNA-binding MarR family transcriptional regulator